MLPYAAFHLGLHCLPKYGFTSVQNENGYLFSFLNPTHKVQEIKKKDLILQKKNQFINILLVGKALFYGSFSDEEQNILFWDQKSTRFLSRHLYNGKSKWIVLVLSHFPLHLQTKNIKRTRVQKCHKLCFPFV